MTVLRKEKPRMTYMGDGGKNLQKLERSERRKLERIRKENELQEACLGEASHGDGQVEPVGRGGRSSGQGILRAGEVKHAVVTAEGRRKPAKYPSCSGRVHGVQLGVENPDPRQYSSRLSDSF
uniref:IBB domain-containing protein n=1 Tax=Branchiostoma floridae TaxID=7739 RepID=C3XUV4_BRAFL|eukprot:XP_002612170.1 hypothetical protein BRAFLDRAFT_125370 [Branchiostoma floridae]